MSYENDRNIETLTAAVSQLTRIVTNLVMKSVSDKDVDLLLPEDREWVNAQTVEEEVVDEEALQEEVNSNHLVERVLDDGENVRISYTGRGRTYGAGAFPMANFNGFAEVGYPYSLRTTVAKLFREAPAITDVTIQVTLTDDEGVEVPLTLDAHARENREVSLFTSDGVYKAVLSVDEVPEDELVY